MKGGPAFITRDARLSSAIDAVAAIFLQPTSKLSSSAYKTWSMEMGSSW
jgi:hypothetical protein